MLTVRYKCHCMAKEAELEVPQRPEGADILAWMEVARACLGLDHAARSPTCPAAAVEYLKIPTDEDAPGIGMKPPLAS
ncbi:MAG: hypothetical protein V4466_11960 [Pseudomonadota bacterium]